MFASGPNYVTKGPDMAKDSTDLRNFQQDTEKSLSPFSGELHAFDTQIAAKYGVYEAILIHHMVFWVKFNQRLKRNFINGRTWTYQTLDEIAAHFPYLNKSQVFDLLEKLSLGRDRRSKNKEIQFEPVLLKGNFNKNKYDRTIWYSFVCEEKWQIPKCILGNPNMEKHWVPEENPINTDIGKCQYGDWEIPTPIPDTKPDTETKESTLKSTKESPSDSLIPMGSFVRIRKEAYEELVEKHSKTVVGKQLSPEGESF